MTGVIKSWIEPKPVLPQARQSFPNAALKAMILPLLIEQVLQMVVGLADTMMVSYAGEAVVAGVGLDTMVYTIFIYLFTAVSAGGAVVVSQYIGSGERENADQAASQIFHIAGLLSLVCMALMLCFGSSLLQAMYPETEETTMRACQTYMWIVAISFPANALYNAGAAVFRAMGQTKITMWASLVANLINVAGNAIGIFVLKAGAAGVAWPTTISWYAAAVIMTYLCMGSPSSRQLLHQLKLSASAQVQVRFAQAIRLFPAMARRILGVAIPNSIENTLFQAAKVVFGHAGGHIWYISNCREHDRPDLLVPGRLHGHSHEHGIHHCHRAVYGFRRCGGDNVVHAQAHAHVTGTGCALERHGHDSDTAPASALRSRA